MLRINWWQLTTVVVLEISFLVGDPVALKIAPSMGCLYDIYIEFLDYTERSFLVGDPVALHSETNHQNT